ncbi:hypothetical protein [Pedobacter aquatilis]|uniref:hypothetical protein n=1 Tax=Pedobacter aquatilis TaxID=351343 RepID=UPI00292EF796|nr:hypothetical protein [Pedobacter aquatilis]
MRKFGIIDFGATLSLTLIQELLTANIKSSRIVWFFDEPASFAPFVNYGIQPRHLSLQPSGGMVEKFSDLEKLIIILPVLEEKNTLELFLEINCSARLAGISHIVIVIPVPGFGKFTEPFFNVAKQMDKLNFGIPYTVLLNSLDRESVFNLDFLNSLDSGFISSATNGKLFNFASRQNISAAIARVTNEDGFENKIYHLTSGEQYGFEDMASVATKTIGTKIRNLNFDSITVKSMLMQAGTTIQQAEFLVDVLHKKIAEGLFEFTTTDLGVLNKGKIESFELFAKRFLTIGQNV